MIIAGLCCAMAMPLLTACGDDEENEITPTYYVYQVFIDPATSADPDELKEVKAAFDEAVGNSKKFESSMDEQMKAACRAVRERFADVKSIYMKFSLYASIYNSGVNRYPIETYEMGQALTKPFAEYNIVNNRTEAYTALSELYRTLDQKVFEASQKALTQLLGGYEYNKNDSGRKNIMSEFEQHFQNELGKLQEENKDLESYIPLACDSIAEACTTDTLAVDAIVAVRKTGFPSGQVTELWRKTFKANIP